jgi:hypothetical protein
MAKIKKVSYSLKKVQQGANKSTATGLCWGRITYATLVEDHKYWLRGIDSIRYCRQRPRCDHLRAI